MRGIDGGFGRGTAFPHRGLLEGMGELVGRNGESSWRRGREIGGLMVFPFL